MRPTVATAVSARSVAKETVVGWVNDEARPVLTQLRDGANALATERRVVDTPGVGSAATTALWTSAPLPTDGTLQVLANVVAVSVSGAAQRAGFVALATFTSTAGGVVQLGATSALATNRTDAAILMVFQVDGSARTAVVAVQDNGASPMHWTGVIQANEGRPT